MTGQSRRQSVHIGAFKHANPIPNASRIGNLVMSGVILGAIPRPEACRMASKRNAPTCSRI